MGSNSLENYMGSGHCLFSLSLNMRLYKMSYIIELVFFRIPLSFEIKFKELETKQDFWAIKKILRYCIIVFLFE